MKYTITGDERVFSSLESAQRELARQVADHQRTQRLLGRPVSVPHWGIYEEGADPHVFGSAVLYADDDE